MTCLATLLILGAQTLSVVSPPVIPADSRVQSIVYIPDQVVTLRVAGGYAVVIEFAPDEAVDNVVVGDSAVWQVTPNRRGDRLVVKPTGAAQPTNMIVVTDTRRYVFQLEPAVGQGASPFVMHFLYPPSIPTALTGSRVNATYQLRGDKTLLPIAMSDDGQRTTISWNPDTTLPAIFAVDGKGHETSVNGHMVGSDYVVEGLASRYVFRHAKARAMAIRKPMVAIR